MAKANKVKAKITVKGEQVEIEITSNFPDYIRGLVRKAEPGEVLYRLYREHSKKVKFVAQRLAHKIVHANDACYELGLRFKLGIGVTKNEELAKYYFSQAACRGDADSLEQLKTISTLTCDDLLTIQCSCYYVAISYYDDCCQKNMNQIIKDVVLNKDIIDLLKRVKKGTFENRNHPYKEFIQAQIDEYDKICHTLDNMGFQFAIPWIGNLINADILFISSNPAINALENCPRLINGNIYKIKEECDPRELKFPKEHKELCTLDYIKDYLYKYMILHIDKNKEEILNIYLLNKRTYAIGYWGSIRNIAKIIIPYSEEKSIKALMNHTACLEIVPFRSNKEIGVSLDAKISCWCKFTRHILRLSNAKIIIIVGKDEYQFFKDYIFINFATSLNEIDEGGYKRIKIAGKDRYVSTFGFNSGKIRSSEYSSSDSDSDE